MKRSKGRPLLCGASLFLICLIISAAFIIAAETVLGTVFNITSDNAAIYFVRDRGGSARITNSLAMGEADRLLFMLDFSCVFDMVGKLEAYVYNKPLLELSWDRQKGEGVLKEYRPDGTKFVVVLSKFAAASDIPDGASIRGVFIGGDLSYGDVDAWREKNRNTSGMSYYDGKRWHHIWCAANEAFGIGSLLEAERNGISIFLDSWDWEYLGSRVLEYDPAKVILQSKHRTRGRTGDGVEVEVTMKRTMMKRAGDDYVVLKTEYVNTGHSPLSISVAYGDEPWVGNYGDSAGDIGWTDSGTYTHQSAVPTLTHSFAGFWDVGNYAIGEGNRFSGYANFIDWTPNPPDFAYFANKFVPNPSDLNKSYPLNSLDNRVINLIWRNEELVPGGSRSFTLSIGMARPSSGGLPVKPALAYN